MMQKEFYLYFIVEGKTDKEFLDYFLKIYQIDKNFTINILDGNDDDKILKATKKGLNELKVFDQSEKHLIFILDQDEKTKEDCTKNINKILKNINKNYILNQKLEQEKLSFHLFLMNPCLEGILNESLQNFSTDHFECLESWRNCLDTKTIDEKYQLSKSEFEKIKNYVHIKYDLCTKTERKQANKNVTLTTALNQNAFHLNHPELFPLKKFLNGFLLKEETKEKNYYERN